MRPSKKRIISGVAVVFSCFVWISVCSAYDLSFAKTSEKRSSKVEENKGERPSISFEINPDRKSEKDLTSDTCAEFDFDVWVYDEEDAYLWRPADESIYSVWNDLMKESDFYYSRGEIKKATKIAGESLNVAQKLFYKTHPNIVRSLNNLAELYIKQKQFDKAERVYECAFAIRRGMWRVDALDIANSLTALAVVNNSLGKYEKSEFLYKRALLLKEKVYGMNHPYTANTMLDLACIYRVRGNYDDAEKFFLKALTIQEKVRGDDPYVALLNNNMAWFYQSRGKYAQAEPFYKRAVEILTKLYGEEHTDVIIADSNLDKFYKEWKKYVKTDMQDKEVTLLKNY